MRNREISFVNVVLCLLVMWIHICSALYYLNKWGWFFDSKRRKINRGILTQYDKR